MKSQRDSQNQSFLNRLDSQNRQLWIRLGKQRDPETMDKLRQQIENKTYLMKVAQSYQRYNQLKSKEIEMRELLEEIERVLEGMKQQSQKLCSKSNQNSLTKSTLLNLMSQIKSGQQIQYKIKKLRKEIESIQGVGVQMNEKQIIHYLGCLDHIKQKIHEERRKIDSENERTKKKIQIMENYLNDEERIWEKLCREKNQLQKRLTQMKQKRISQLIVQKSRQERFRIEQASEFEKQSQDSYSNYQVQKVITSHSKIQQKAKIPLFYYCWAILLFVWTLLLYSSWSTGWQQQVSMDYIQN